MRNLLSFSTKNNFLGFFAWVWVKVHFPLERSLIDLIYLNHYLIHLQKCRFSTLFNIMWKKIFITDLYFLTVSQFFVNASLKSNSPYLLLNKNINLKTRRNQKWKFHTNLCEESCFSSCKNHKLKLKLWWVGARERKKSAIFLTFI